MMGAEAKIEGNGIYFNGWFKWIVGGLAAFFVMSMFTVISYAIQNDVKYMRKIEENKVLSAENRQIILYIRDDIQEMKRDVKVIANNVR